MTPPEFGEEPGLDPPFEPRAAPAKPFKVDERPTISRLKSETIDKKGPQRQAGRYVAKLLLPISVEFVSIFWLLIGRPSPDPVELPDELDFDPDEPNAAPARPFSVEERPVTVLLVFFFNQAH